MSFVRLWQKFATILGSFHPNSKPHQLMGQRYTALCLMNYVIYIFPLLRFILIVSSLIKWFFFQMLETLHKDHKDLIDGAINHNKNKTDPSTKKVSFFKFSIHIYFMTLSSEIDMGLGFKSPSGEWFFFEFSIKNWTLEFRPFFNILNIDKN